MNTRREFIRRCASTIVGVGLFGDALLAQRPKQFDFPMASNLMIPSSPYLTDPNAWYLKGSPIVGIALEDSVEDSNGKHTAPVRLLT